MIIGENTQSSYRKRNNSKIKIISDVICTAKEKYAVLCKWHQMKIYSPGHKVLKIQLVGQTRNVIKLATSETYHKSLSKVGTSGVHRLVRDL